MKHPFFTLRSPLSALCFVFFALCSTLTAQTAQQTNTNGANIDTDGEANSFLTALARGTSISFSELQYIDGLTSNAQTQIDGKLSLSGGTMAGNLLLGGFDITGADEVVGASFYSAGQNALYAPYNLTVAANGGFDANPYLRFNFGADHGRLTAPADLSGTPIWTLPATTGTVALTSDLSLYIPTANIGTTVQAWSAILDGTTASFTSALETKLNGIEALADVTDTANVTAAGALMDSELTSLSGVKTLTIPDNTTVSAFGASLVDDATAGDARITLGLGTLATQSGTFSGISSGTNTGDQTSIVGITGSLSDFNAALTGADFATGGGTATGINTGDQTNITGNAGTVTDIGNLTGVVTSTNRATSIANGAITNDMLANSAVANLSGTNTGDNAVNSLYSGLVSNATHTGDATGDTALSVIRIQGTPIAAPVAGDDGKVIKYDHGTTSFVYQTLGGGGDLLAANNLSDLANFATARDNLGVEIGVDVQAYSAILSGTTASFLTAQETKLGHITVTQAVNLDTMESDIATNNAKVTNATHTGDATGSGSLTVVAINGTNLASLGTGLLKNTTGTGVPSIAVAGTDYLTPTGSAAGLTSFPTLNQNTTGSAATLTTPRNINGVAFNGSADITVTAAAGTLTGTTLNATVTGSSLTSLGTINTGVWQGTAVADSYISSAATWNAKQSAITFGTGVQTALGVNIGSAGAPVLFDGAGGTPSSITLTNGTGLPISTGVSGLGTGVATLLTTPSSANLRAAITDETGTGVAVFNDNPTLTNPTVTNFTESVVAIGNTGTSQTIALTNGTVQTATLTGNCTFTMPAATAGKSFTLFLKSGAGGFTSTFTSVKWAGGTAPTITTTASRLDIISFISDGTNWYGSFIQDFTH